MAYVPNTNSVISYQAPGSVISASVFGAVAVTNPVGSVAAFIQSGNSSIISVPQGSVATVIVGGSIAASFTPPANQSVSGTVGTSIIGLAPVKEPGFASSGNNLFSSIASNGSVQGTWETNDIADVMVSTVSDQNGTLFFDFSNDGGTTFNTFPTAGFAITANQHEIHEAVKGPRTFRTRFTNGSSGTTATKIYTYFGDFDKLTAPLNQSLSTDADATITRAIIAGETTAGGGGLVNVKVNPSGTLETNAAVSGTVTANQGTGFGSIAAHIKSGSVIAVLGGNTSVVATQGTTPWVNTNVGSIINVTQGSVGAVIIGGSIASAGVANQSVSGTVQTDVRGSVAVAIISGSVAVATGNSSVQVLNFPANQSVSGTIGSSIIGQAVASGSYGNAPIVIRPHDAGAFSDSYANNPQNYVDENYNQVIQPVFPFVYNGTTWDRVRGDATNGTKVYGSVSGTVNASVNGTVKIFPASMVAGHGSVNGAASVALLPAPGTGLYNYMTDFTISNTGANTTLITFTDGDSSIIGRTIAPAGGGAVGTGLITPIRTMQTNKVINMVAATASSVVYGWAGGYKAP